MGADNENVLQRLSGGENCVLGIAAGAIEVGINQPMLYCKNAVQQGLPFTMDPRVLYRGVTMSAMNMGGLTGLQFYLSGFIQKQITAGSPRSLTAAEEMGAGFLGGAISGLPCCVMELVMIQQQRFGGSIVGTASRLMRSQGAPILMRGFITSSGREGIYTLGYLGLVPVVQRELVQRYNCSPVMGGIAGSICAGCFAGWASHPLDTIKTCMQGDVEGTKYTSITSTARLLYQEGGIGAFYNGLFWRCGRMISAVFILHNLKIQLAPVMFPKYFNDK
mmetsp:Transcript_11433/g.23999  ORF Transcript_11433/g.23999 Transcript_11433/m.23999 type:complete len:277 (+) Transcript_11433:90-920(+)